MSWLLGVKELAAASKISELHFVASSLSLTYDLCMLYCSIKCCAI